MITGNAIANAIYWEFMNPSNAWVEESVCPEECEACTIHPCVNEEMEGRFVYDDEGEMV